MMQKLISTIAGLGRPTTRSQGPTARGAAVYGPNGGVGAWSAYNPTTGTYAHDRVAVGPNTAGGTASFYNLRTGIGGATAQYSNLYGH